MTSEIPGSELELKPSPSTVYKQKQTKSLARISSEEILADLRRYDRTPFLRVLADIMGCPPSLDALQRFADEHPDRWTFAVATMARIGGFTEKTEVVGNVHHHIHLMSDAELKQRIRQLEAQTITEADYEEVISNPDVGAEPSAG